MIKLSSSFSGEMVDIYDSFFLSGDKCLQDRDYIKRLLDGVGVNGDVLLDVGCGTGAYDEVFSELYSEIIAVDISEDMVAYAKRKHQAKNVSYICSDATGERLFSKEKADVAISLAHVIGYQYANESVDAFFNTVHMNLKDGGHFFFNFYNLFAVLSGKLSPRSVVKESGSARITRISNASFLMKDSCVGLDYYYMVEDEDNAKLIEIHEKMRSFSLMEIEHYLKHNGFKVLAFFDYGEQLEKLTYDNWNVACLAQKVE